MTKDIYIPIPKKNPLTPINEHLAAYAEKIVVAEKENEEKEIKLQGQTTIDLLCKRGASCTLNLIPPEEGDIMTELLVRLQAGVTFTVRQSMRATRRSDTIIRIALEGRGSNARCIASFHGKHNDQHGLRILMHHQAEYTTGDIRIRGVYEDKARAMFAGLIKVEQNAQGTNSYFQDDILLADEGIAESLPTLEIEANQVKASHGSTTSRINEEQIFYLQSRGLGRDVARQMIIDGFLQGIIEGSRLKSHDRSK